MFDLVTSTEMESLLILKKRNGKKKNPGITPFITYGKLLNRTSVAQNNFC